jgi:ankyrin repeat protein
MHRHFGAKEGFITENRTVKLLSDSEELMPENIKKETKFVDLIVRVSKENVESVFKQITEDKVNKACEIIDFSVDIRPLEIENFLTLVSLISSKFGVDNLPYFSDYFWSLLIARGVLPPLNGEEEYNEPFTEFAKGSIEHSIREDNVEQFSKLISDPSFNAKNKVNFGSVNRGDSMLNECESYMQLITFCGAVNCFRQAIMNDAFDLKCVSEYAIAGGSNEIVRILEQKGISFDNCFEVGVNYHRMDLCDWLLMHTKCESIDLLSSLEYFNYPSFFFTMINENSFNIALSIASGKNDISLVKYLIEQCHVDVEAKDIIGWTSLHYASRYGRIEVVKYLIEQCDANVEVRDNNGSTPLHYSSRNGKIEVVKYLINHCHANVEARDNNGNTPLHIASENGKIEVIKYLIERSHADVEAKNNGGRNPLHIASSNGHIEVVKYLFEQCRADVEVKDNSGRTPLQWASIKGQNEVVRCLFEQCHADAEAKNDDGWTPLHCASANGQIEVVKYLFEQSHANAEAKDKYGRTPLHYASIYGKIEVVKYLFEQCNADVDANDNNGWIPLHFATQNDNIEIVKYLIEQCHVNVEVKNNNGETPLHIASIKGHIEVVTYLVEQCHASVEVKDNNGRTPFDRASSSNGIREYFQSLVN